MLLTQSQRQPYWRTLLILGRVSNLPTVWSNCLAGWLLAEGGTVTRLIQLCVGATFLYLGGMFLNDAFDADFDQQHRQERPIPSGAITLDAVWRWGFILLGAGAAALILLGVKTGLLSVLLLACILAYDATHKLIASAPILMAGCRLLLYLTAASSAAAGITGLAIWSALALAAYIIGLSYLARRESTGGAISLWPCLLLVVPLFLALIVNGRGFERTAMLLCMVFGLWTARCLSHTLLTTKPNPGRAVAGLLAGIVLVDLLAVAGGDTIWITALFLLLFIGALVLQRCVPAT